MPYLNTIPKFLERSKTFVPGYVRVVLDDAIAVDGSLLDAVPRLAREKGGYVVEERKEVKEEQMTEQMN